MPPHLRVLYWACTPRMGLHLPQDLIFAMSSQKKRWILSLSKLGLAAISWTIWSLAFRVDSQIRKPNHLEKLYSTDSLNTGRHKPKLDFENMLAS